MNAPSPRSALSALMIRGPRGAFRWTAFVLAVTSLMAATPTPLYPVYERLFGFSSGTLGIVFGAYTLGVLLTLFLVAPMAERVGRKKLLYLAMALTALGALVFAFANGVLWLTLGRAICGLGVGATSSVATAAMSDLEPRHDQHHVARVAVAANFGGFAVGVAVSGVVVEFAPYPTHLAYLLPLVACALGFFAVSVTPETATRPRGQDRGRDPAHRRAGGVATSVLGRGDRDRRLLLDLRAVRRPHSVVRPSRFGD
jgi:MFS family permease